jgi:hypothetical protein
MASTLDEITQNETSLLKIELDVLASTCIKRKKPWPKLALVEEVSS